MSEIADTLKRYNLRPYQRDALDVVTLGYSCRCRTVPINSIECTITLKEPEMKIDITTTPATVTIDGKEIPSWQWSNAIREAVAKAREKASEPERPENEAWYAGSPDIRKGTMSIEGAHLVIRWSNGIAHRYLRYGILTGTGTGTGTGARAEGQRRLAFFDRHRDLADNEVRRCDGTIFEQRWHNGEKQVKGSANVWFRHTTFDEPENDKRADAWFEKNRPLAENEVRLPNGEIVELKLLSGPMFRLRGGAWSHWGAFGTPGYEAGDRWFAREILRRVGE